MESTLNAKLLSVVLVVGLLSGAGGGYLGATYLAPVQTSTSPAIQPVQLELTDETSAVIDAIERVSPSVVSIVITQELSNIRRGGSSPFELFFENDPFFEDFFGQRVPIETIPEGEEEENTVRQKVGGGSGFILNEEGLILTNRHVVSTEGAEYTVLLSNGEEYEAEVVSRDFFNDIAVIKLIPGEGEPMPELTPVKLGKSSDLKIGQGVIAIGNALAEFSNSATEGIISAKGRSITASDGTGSGQNLSGLIQTDAAINPGNSGGPLINLAGEVVGVNTAIAANANGIGFAIPIDDVKPVVDSVISNGRIVRPILGVMFTMITPELAEQLDLPVDQGALLRGDGNNFAVLPDKPAEKAGLLEKDIIIEVDGQEVNDDNPLQQIIMRHAPGDVIEVKYLRQGEEQTTEITLEEANFEE